eukprot:5489833-Lingulodinium_polyedra.AAC.1
MAGGTYFEANPDVVLAAIHSPRPAGRRPSADGVDLPIPMPDVLHFREVMQHGVVPSCITSL